MTKTYTFTDIPKITSPTATAVAGGSLLANTTYYYRIYKIRQSGSPYSYGRSIISDEFSVTTDSTNRTARITFSSPKVNGQGYMIFRFTTSGQINIYTNAVNFWPTDITHNVGGTVTFDDTGYAATTGNTFLENKDNPHGILILSGSSSSDKFSIEDLYNEDIANGWGVITRLDENTYKVNTHLSMGTTEYFDAVEKTIIFADGINSPGNWTLGRVSGTNRTYGGCNIIIKSNWLTSINFNYLEAYRTSFQYIFPKTSSGNDISSGLGLCHISFHGIVQDCTCDRSRSFSPSNTSVVKNCIVSRFDVAFNTSQATFDDVKCLSGSRVWQIGGSTTNVVAKGVYTEATSAVLVINGSTGSSLTVIDSIISNPMIGSYSGNNGFEYFDKFSYNLQILEEDGLNPIANVTVIMYDNSEKIFEVTTDAEGNITEQLITRVYGIVNTPSLPSVYTYTDKFPYKLIIKKNGYETYTEDFTQTQSLPIKKVVTLKKQVPVLISLDGKIAIKSNPENEGKNREIIINI